MVLCMGIKSLTRVAGSCRLTGSVRRPRALPWCSLTMPHVRVVSRERPAEGSLSSMRAHGAGCRQESTFIIAPGAECGGACYCAGRALTTGAGAGWIGGVPGQTSITPTWLCQPGATATCPITQVATCPATALQTSLECPAAGCNAKDVRALSAPPLHGLGSRTLAHLHTMTCVRHAVRVAPPGQPLSQRGNHQLLC